MSTQLAHHAPQSQSSPNPSGPVAAEEKKSAGHGEVPSITTAPKKKWGVLKGVLFVGVCGVAWYFSPQWLPRLEALVKPPVAEGRPSGPRVVPVVTAPVEQKDFIRYINCLGTITPYNMVTIRSRVEGEVTAIKFTEGQNVKAGDLLIEIDPRPFRMQRDQARAQVVRDEATLKLAEVTLTRQLDLMKSQASTPQVVDQQVAQVGQSKAALQMSQAMLENAELQLQYCQITSPIDGRIGLRLVDKGNIVQANSPNGLAVITQLEPISLVFTIPQDDIPRVLNQINLVGQLTVEAFDRDFRTRLAEGTLTALDNQVDATTGTLRLKATFSNEDHALFPNQFVNARLRVETIANALTVPNAALQRGPRQTYVYVVKKDNKVELRPIQLGPADGASTVVLEGLEFGEVVVTNGLDKLQDGTTVSTPNSQNESTTPSGKGKPASDKGAA